MAQGAQKETDPNAKPEPAQKETLPAGIAFDDTDPNAEPEAEPSGSPALQAGAGLLLALLVNIAAIL